MIAPPSGVRVLVTTKPIDFRKGANGLAALIKDEMRADPYSGVIYVFRAKRADRIKLLYWDGTGVVLCYKRLERGLFELPTPTRPGEQSVVVSEAAFEALFAGLSGMQIH